MELATSPVEVVINEVNSEALASMGAEADAQWGKKPAEPAAAAAAPEKGDNCLLYTSPSPRDKRQSRMPSSA